MSSDQKHLENLRNKFGRISTYFQVRQLLDTETNPVKVKKLKELLNKLEDTIYDDVKRFEQLLKK